MTDQQPLVGVQIGPDFSPDIWTDLESAPRGTSASRGVRAGPDRSRYRDPKKNILTRDHREQTQHLDQLPIYALSVFFVLFSFLNDTLEYVEKETIVGFPVGALVGTVTDLETTPYFS
jgi:hypothetical protein